MVQPMRLSRPIYTLSSSLRRVHALRSLRFVTLPASHDVEAASFASSGPHMSHTAVLWHDSVDPLVAPLLDFAPGSSSSSTALIATPLPLSSPLAPPPSEPSGSWGAVAATVAAALDAVGVTQHLCGLHLPMSCPGLSIGTRRPGHLSTTRGRPCGAQRPPERARTWAPARLTRQRPCSLVLLRRLRGLHLPPSRPGLSVGTQRPWLAPSAPWPRHLLSGQPGSPTREPLTTPLPTRVYSPLFTLLRLILRPSSSIMVANGSCLPVTSVGAADAHGSFRLPDVLVAPSMVHNLFVFIVLQLTTLVPLSLTLLVLP